MNEETLGQPNASESVCGQLPLRPELDRVLRLSLRARVQPFKGSDEWEEVPLARQFPVARTALLLCDVWDLHWCAGANRRLGAMLPRMNEVVGLMRENGVQIVHAPSGTMGFYVGTPQRLRAQAAPCADAPAEADIAEPPLPVDSSDGGCDDERQCRSYKAWTRQHPAIEIGEHDAVSDEGQEVYNHLRQLGIENLLITGVHTNMCVLGRSFAIRQMTRWGIRCVLIRDLTDAMYNPRMSPYVSHEEGTKLVIEHIEKHWCPTVLSEDLLAACS